MNQLISAAQKLCTMQHPSVVAILKKGGYNFEAGVVQEVCDAVVKYEKGHHRVAENAALIGFNFGHYYAKNMSMMSAMDEIAAAATALAEIESAEDFAWGEFEGLDWETTCERIAAHIDEHAYESEGSWPQVITIILSK
jgi:hypothetical protein